MVDFAFEAVGYHYVPHSARYVIALTMLTAPLYLWFFLKCMMGDDMDFDDEDDPRDKKSFNARYAKWESRRKKRIRDGAIKFD